MQYLTNLTAKQLRQVMKLLKKKEVLETRHAQRVASINAQIDRIGIAKKRGRPRVSVPTGSVASTPRGGLKMKILEALKEAASSGLTAKELAASLKVDPNNLYAWFYSTGKKISGLKKSKDGRYVYEG